MTSIGAQLWISRARNGALYTSNCGRCLGSGNGWATPGHHDGSRCNEDSLSCAREDSRAREGPCGSRKVVPKDHPFGSKRVPLETEYYEAYNRDSCAGRYQGTPIERITPKGIKTSDRNTNLTDHLCHRL